MQKIICQKCQFYFVTWQQDKPHGCKAYGFKSRLLPAMVVFQSSGMKCSFYKPKITKD
jgi:hypothetical protein